MFEPFSDIYFVLYKLYYVGQNDNLGIRVSLKNWDNFRQNDHLADLTLNWSFSSIYAHGHIPFDDRCARPSTRTDSWEWMNANANANAQQFFSM
jgi:hypothetical protein